MPNIGFWAVAAAGGGAAAYELISTTVLGSNSASVTFSGSSAWTPYKHLQVRWTARSDRASNVGDGLLMRFNDLATNTNGHALFGNGSTVTSSSGENNLVGRMAASTAPTSAFGAGVIDILDWQSSTNNKTVRGLSGGGVGLTAGSDVGIYFTSFGWYVTTAITSLVFDQGAGTNFVTGSRFSLYGVRGS